MKQTLLSSNELLEILSLSENATAIYTTENIIIQSATDTMLRFWGQDRHIIGMSLRDAIPELINQPFFNILQNVWRTGNTYVAKDSPATLLVEGKLQTVYFDFTYRAIKKENGEMYCILHTANDVSNRYKTFQAAEQNERQVAILNTELASSNARLTTVNKDLWETVIQLQTLQQEQQQTLLQLQQNEQRLQSILDTMAEGVGITDATGQMIYANKMAEKTLGINTQDILKRTYHDKAWENLRIDGSPLPQEEHPIYRCMLLGQPLYDQEISVQPPDRERFYISINATPLYDTAGNLAGGLGTFMDVTNRRKDIQQKDDFISIASHELKTPITSLKASLQLLSHMQENPSPVLLPKLIEQCNRSMDKLAVLVDELLETSKLSQGQLQLHKSSFSITEMLKHCCNHVRMAGKHQLILQGDADIQMYADEHRIDQVVINFVNNAVKYAPQSTNIYLIVEKQSGAIKVSVKDNGPGISQEKLSHLFKRYYQVNDGSSKQSGLGLGLYISSEIIAKHGGQIGVDSTLGQGSTFWFTIPDAA